MIGSRGAGRQQTGPIKRWKRKETTAGVKRVSFFFEQPANPNIAAQCSRTPRAIRVPPQDMHASVCISTPPSPRPQHHPNDHKKHRPRHQDKMLPHGFHEGTGGGVLTGEGERGGGRGGVYKSRRAQETKEDAFLQNPLVLAATRLKKTNLPKQNETSSLPIPIHLCTNDICLLSKLLENPQPRSHPHANHSNPHPPHLRSKQPDSGPLLCTAVVNTRPTRTASLEKPDGLSRALSSSQVPCASSSPCDALFPVSRSLPQNLANPTVFRARREGGGEGGRAAPRQDTKEERSGETSRDGQFSACSLT